MVTPEQAIEQVFSVVIPGSGYVTPEGDVESATPMGTSPRMKVSCMWYSLLNIMLSCILAEKEESKKSQLI